MSELSDKEKLALIKCAVQDFNAGKMSPFLFSVRVGAIVSQPEISLDDLGWGAKQLIAIREAAQPALAG